MAIFIKVTDSDGNIIRVNTDKILSYHIYSHDPNYNTIINMEKSHICTKETPEEIDKMFQIIEIYGEKINSRSEIIDLSGEIK